MKFFCKIFQRNIFLFFISISISFANKDNIPKDISWIELLPEDAFDFVPESGVTDEMWNDPEFIQKVEQAGLATVPSLEGKYIRVIGFMVPLEVDYGEAETVNEFVFVPSPGMCMHVPPPPPNQLILIKLSKPEIIRMMYQPIGVIGKISINPPKEDTFGSVYLIANPTSIEDVVWDDLNLGQ